MHSDDRLLSHHTTVWLGYIVYFGACVCTLTNFLAAEKDSGVKLRMLVRLLSGMGFSHFGELWARVAPPEAYEHLGKKEKLGPATYTNRSGEKISRRAIAGELWPSGRRVGSRNLAPYFGICVLLANAVVCQFCS